MEFQINKSEFIRGLRLASNIADRKSTMPILANVLIKSNGDSKISVVATNLLSSVALELDAKVQKEGAITVGAKALYEITNGLPGEQVALKMAENGFAIISSKKSSYKLFGINASNFPKIPDWNGVACGKIDAKLLASMIDKVMPSIASDDSHANITLNGCLYESNGNKTVMVSTDGHRLAKVEQDTADCPVFKEGILVPRKGLVEIGHVLESANGTVEIGFDNVLFVKSGSVVLSIKTIDSQFPPYEQVIPKNNPHSIRLDRKEFFEAIKRTTLVTTKGGGIRFWIENGALNITGDNPELGEGRESIEIDYQGPSQVIGLNAKYMLEFLAEMSADSVTIEVAGENDPIILRPTQPDGYLCLVMPMRM